MSTSLDVKSLRPYLSATFLNSPVSGLKGKQLAKSVMLEVVALLESQSSKAVLKKKNVAAFGSLFVGIVVYSEASSPSWWPTSSLEDISHHSVSILCRDGWCALVTSDSAPRKALVACITEAAPLGRKLFSSAFVGPDAKAMWLNGIHTRSDAKAEGKVLLGAALEHAIDPLGDHTFAMSAIRSQPRIARLLSGTRQIVVGASLGSSSLWIGRASSWDIFINQVEALFDHLDGAPAATSLYKSLAQSVDDISVVKNAYAVAILPPLLLGDDPTATAAELTVAQYWANEAKYIVKAGIGANFNVDVEVGGSSLGTFSMKVTSTSPPRVELGGKWFPSNHKLELIRDQCAQFLKDPSQIKIYYDSGHTISTGECFESGWTDQLFDWKFEDLTGFDVEKEKPIVPAAGKLADEIGTPSDDSLFGYIQKKLFSKGWLACDDGAMELADFVHFDPNNGLITLIHAKGAGTNNTDRQVSVADYEIVVSQGVKNIRHLRMSSLVKALEAGKTKDISRAVWLDGKKQADRSGIIAELKKWPDSAPRRLMILQPRLTEKENDYCLSSRPAKHRLLRFQQLSALILSGRVAAMSAGADFVAIAAK
jgi:hypothetical protein